MRLTNLFCILNPISCQYLKWDYKNYLFENYHLKSGITILTLTLKSSGNNTRYRVEKSPAPRWPDFLARTLSDYRVEKPEGMIFKR
jgi:hypothetical protein